MIANCQIRLCCVFGLNEIYSFETLQAPKELEDSHPAIAQEMSRTWTEAWGEGVCGPVIVGLGGGLGIV